MPAETHSTHEPVTPAEVFTMVRGHLAEILEVDDDTITMESTFADDLNADSLALIELVEALEEDLGDLKSVRDAVDYVIARLGAAPSAPGSAR